MKSEYQITIIGKIRKLREEHGYSQAQLAVKLDISSGQLGNIESINPPHKYTLSQIYKVSKLFNIPLEEIFIGEKEQDSETNVTELLIRKIIEYAE